MFTGGLMIKSIGLVSPASQLNSTRSFSTSSTLFVKKSIRYIRANLRREANILKQRKLIQENSKFDPVLGKPNNAFISRLNAEAKEPNVLGKGYKVPEVERLLYGAQEASIKADYTSDGVRQNAAKQREAIFRILNMRNRSAKEALKFKTDLARKEFERFDGDTGSSEVQAAIATVKIHNIYSHVKENKNDNKNTRYLRMLVQQRQRILKYLKRDNPERYFWTINKLGLNDHVVHMEFNMDKRYMEQFKMFGDRVLVKKSQREKERERKEKRLEKKALKMKIRAKETAARK